MRTYYYTPSPSSPKISRSMGRSMRTIHSKHFQTDLSGAFYEKSFNVSENLTDSVIDLRLGELANKSPVDSKASSSSEIDEFLDISQAV
ncbi:U-box domain-containing 4-like, partial [Olea europaea subsp. europaea]